MGAPELLALSLGLSVAVAALAWAAGRLVERLCADPELRDRVWATALILPALPPLAIGLLLLTPAPVREIPPGPVSLTTPFVATTAEFIAAAPPPAFAFDPTLAAWAVLGIAALLTLARLTALALRARRLVRIIRQAQAPGPAVLAMVETAARDLAISAPRVGISAETPEALLASLGRARLILPMSLTDGANPVAVRTVIAHELAHLKRGDHRTLWLEEALLALLAVNPLMPLLRARRSAAREEACDALALGEAAPETRRAYAQSLIEALRDRAGPQASGGLPALTFTGAGRTTAMSRLKAVLNPAPAAGRGSRLTAVGLGGLIAVLAGAGSLAVAAERETVVRVQPVSAAPAVLAAPSVTPASPAEERRTVDLGAGARELLNGDPLPEGLPVWALSPERVDIRTAGDGPGTVNFILPFTGSTPVSLNGRRMPAGFPASGVNGDAVARVDIVGDHVRYTLKPEAEVRRARRDAEAAPQATESRLTAEQQARYSGLSAAGYKTACASNDPGDDGFCAGVMFNVLERAPQIGICAPTAATSPDATGADLGAFVDRGRREMARMRPNADEGAYGFAERALKQAYPCAAGRAEANEVVVRMPVALDYGRQPPTLLPGETLSLKLRGQVGDTRLAMNLTFSADADGRAPSMVTLPLTRDYFPTLGGPHAFELSGTIGVGETARLTSDPTTLRLAAGSEASARRLGPTLSFE